MRTGRSEDGQLEPAQPESKPAATSTEPAPGDKTETAGAEKTAAETAAAAAAETEARMPFKYTDVGFGMPLRVDDTVLCTDIVH